MAHCARCHCSRNWVRSLQITERAMDEKVAIFHTIVELFATVVSIVIVSNPNLMNQEFITYMSHLFSTSTKQFEIWIVGGVIIIFVVYAAISIFDGFRKARIR